MVNLANFRPRRPLIPCGWEERHAPILDGSRTAIVELWSGPADGTPEWVYDPTTKAEVRNHGTRLHADGTITARIQRLGTGTETEAGAQDVTIRTYLIALPRHISDGLTPHARVHVTEINDDHMQGRWLQVIDIQGGSLRFERHLIALDNLG